MFEKFTRFFDSFDGKKLNLLKPLSQLIATGEGCSAAAAQFVAQVKYISL